MIVDFLMLLLGPASYSSQRRDWHKYRLERAFMEWVAEALVIDGGIRIEIDWPWKRRQLRYRVPS